MSYYHQKGDFYTGATGYYVGDPGFLSGFFGDVKNIVTRNVAPAVMAYATGGPAGLASNVAGQVARRYAGGGTLPAVRSVNARMGVAPRMSLAGAPPMITGAGLAALPMATRVGGAALVRTGARKALTAAGAALPGVLSTALTGGGAPAIHPAFLGRRRRRMNVCNPRALRRAIRRTHGFAKLAMKTIHIVHPKKHARFGGFRKRKRK